MPGGYADDRGDVDIRQGALIDRGGAVYMVGRNGGLMNDVRGHTTVQHLFEAYPDLEPKRIVDLGCAVGAMLRYAHAHARAERLGQRVHYVQDNAERTRFPDGSFDFVYSCVLLHETSKAATRKIFAESHRLLRPGGVVIHREVPPLDSLGVWGRVMGDFESLYNNEPFRRGVRNLDVTALMHEAGSDDVKRGFQLATPAASRSANKGFSDKSGGVFRSWLMISARK